MVIAQVIGSEPRLFSSHKKGRAAVAARPNHRSLDESAVYGFRRSLAEAL
jgi:hypothetical protein